MHTSASITSKRRRFAPPTTINDHFSPSTHLSPSGLLSPSLPAEVQASLFQVGMRIRKAVPAGYKTQAMSRTIKPKPSSQQPVSSKALASELTPFCGINRVGGYQYQLHAEETEHDASCFPSSQESSTSSMAPPPSPPTKKRNHSASSDDLVEHINIFRSSMSPPLRPIAQPKTRIRRSPRSNAWGGFEYDVMEWDDFEEAQFLQPLEKLGPGTHVPFG